MQRMIRGIAIIVIGVALTVAAPQAWAVDIPGTNAQVDKSKIAVFRLSGMLREAPSEFDWGFDVDQINLYELLERLSKAKKDPNLDAVVLLFDEAEIGWAQRQEIRDAVHDLKAADKTVYAYLEEVDARTYLLAAAASKVYVAPTGNLSILGLHLEQGYLKGLLDKIGVTADIEHIGAYKGAGEPFTRTGPSEEAREMLDWLVSDLFDQMVQSIAEDRQLQPDEVRSLIDRGPFNAEEAKEAGLVDEIAYPEELVASLNKRYGDGVEFTHNYGEKELPEVDLSSPFGFFKLFSEMMQKSRAATKPQIAVVYLDGMIVTGKTEDDIFGDSGLVGSTTLRRTLAKARTDDQIKAVVLRISSPGGSAVASDIIWHATKALGKEKPLIVSMGDVAASGGYYTAVAGSTIFADPGTITGSIGVVGGKLVTSGLWDWAGISFHEISRGQHADLYNTNRPFTEEQREIVRGNMRDVYEAFKERVREGREDRLEDELDDLAGGRVFTGRQARANGLVDQLGGLQAAIKHAASEAAISNYEIVQLPEPKNFFELFVKSLAGETEDEPGDTVQIATRGWLLNMPAVSEVSRMLGRIDPAKTRMVLRMLFRLELLSRENALLVTPTEFLIR